MRDKIFISYCHADDVYLERLRKHLSAFKFSASLEFWSDIDLRPGAVWEQTIHQFIDETAVAIFLISADFMSSEFIQSQELPRLLEAWEKYNIRLLPVIVKPCNHHRLGKLKEIQAINDPKKTLSEMTEPEQERIWAKLSDIAYEETSKYIKNHTHKKELPFSFSEKPLLSPELETYIKHLSDHSYEILSYNMYQYSSDSSFAFLSCAKDLFQNSPFLSPVLAILERQFSLYGWSKTGEIYCSWMPSFLNLIPNAKKGVLIWLVRNFNTKTIYVASPIKLPCIAPVPLLLQPDSHGSYVARIIEISDFSPSQFCCYRIHGLVKDCCSPVEGETHWLFYNIGKFPSLNPGDVVTFSIKNLSELESFPERSDIRTIYPKTLQKLNL